MLPDGSAPIDSAIGSQTQSKVDKAEIALGKSNGAKVSSSPGTIVVAPPAAPAAGK